MDYSSILNNLENSKDDKHAQLLSKLVPNISKEKILGIKIKKLKQLAKEIYLLNKEQYLNSTVEFKYVEEVILYSLVLGVLKDKDEFLKYLDRFLINNNSWLTNDSSTIHKTMYLKNDLYDFIYNLPKHYENKISDLTYVKRYSLLVFKIAYNSHEYLSKNLGFILMNNMGSYYYKMMASWLIEYFFHKFSAEIIEFLSTINDSFIFKKSIQKICESRFTTDDEKQKLKNLKISKRFIF